jgi:hypothetical protein
MRRSSRIVKVNSFNPTADSRAVRFRGGCHQHLVQIHVVPPGVVGLIAEFCPGLLD